MPVDSEGNISPGGSFSGPPMNRKQRRKYEHRKNRQFTKKGFTRVIKRDDNGQIWNIPTKKGSRIHNIATHNVKKMHRKPKEDKREDAANEATDRSDDAPEVSERANNVE